MTRNDLEDHRNEDVRYVYYIIGIKQTFPHFLEAFPISSFRTKLMLEPLTRCRRPLHQRFSTCGPHQSINQSISFKNRLLVVCSHLPDGPRAWPKHLSEFKG